MTLGGAAKSTTAVTMSTAAAGIVIAAGRVAYWIARRSGHDRARARPLQAMADFTESVPSRRSAARDTPGRNMKAEAVTPARGISHAGAMDRAPIPAHRIADRLVAEAAAVSSYGTQFA